MDKYLLLISGKKQAGKSTAGEHILKRIEASNKSFKYIASIVSFGDELKNTINSLFDIPLELMYGTDEQKNSKTNIKWKDFPISNETFLKLCKERDLTIYEFGEEFLTVRELMQYFGTEVCRKIDNLCWVKAFNKKINKMEQKLIINTDARFLEELDFPYNRKVVKLRLTRNVFNDNHSSETSLDNYSNFDFVIDNKNSRLEQMLGMVDSFYDNYLFTL